jgi:hypothetical protein
MIPNLTQVLAEQRIAEMRRDAAASRLAAALRSAGGAAAGGTRPRRAARLLRSLRGRRYRQIELVWPDGVCSVVPAQSDDKPRPLTSSRR